MRAARVRQFIVAVITGGALLASCLVAAPAFLALLDAAARAQKSSTTIAGAQDICSSSSSRLVSNDTTGPEGSTYGKLYLWPGQTVTLTLTASGTAVPAL